MIELSTHIEYMLLSRSEVRVPGLGTFTRREMSSRRVDEEGIFLPPYRTVSFQWNAQEAGEDFIMSLSRLHSLSRREAHIVCMEYVDELQQRMSEEGSVSVGSMGYLIQSGEGGEASFVPVQSGIASPACYGLDVVPFAKLSHDARQQRDKNRSGRRTKVTSIQADHDAITIRINRRLFNYVSTVAASIVLFFTFTSPFSRPAMIADGRQMAESVLRTPISLSGAGEKVSGKADVKAVTAVRAVKTNPAEDAKPRHEAEATESAKAEEAVPQAMPEEASAPSYAIVLASAISKKNAVSFAEKLRGKGYNALACEYGGMVRVIIPGFATQDAAYAEIRRMKAESKELAHAWPCLLKDEVKSLSPTLP